MSKRQIAAQLGVHPTTVGRWVNAPDRQQDG
ncbi:MAG: helix-turn-helix domain-containing protein, partial [Galactobacter sp.]